MDRIKQELIVSGEIEGTLTDESQLDPQSSLGYSEEESQSRRDQRIRGALRASTEHLSRQRAQGIDADERSRRMIKMMLVLLALGFVLWYFVFR